MANFWNAVQRKIVLTDKEVECWQALSDTVTDSRDDKAAVEERKGPRVDGTSEWILKHPPYISWINSTCDELLWLSGSPGIGKTMISCYLIDRLTEIKRQTDEMVLVYFLCDDTNNKRNTALAIIRGLLLQLLRERPHLFKHIMPEYEEKKASIFGDIHGLLRIFWCVVGDTDLRQVFLVIDALDECEEVSRNSLLKSLHKHLNASSPGDRNEAHRVKLLITSRPLPGDVDKEITTPSQRIELSSALVNEDLQIYITQRVKDLEKYHFSPNQLERIEGDLLARSESTFLWVSIVLEEMKKLPPDEAEEILPKTPNDLNELYKKILLQIRSNSNFFNQVQLLLSWIANAFRPLTVHQLATALLLNKSLNKKRNLSRLPTESDLQGIEATLSHCRTLVRVQDQNRTVHLLHQTLKEFLLTGGTILTPQQAHFQVLQTLVQNLCLDDMNDNDAIDSGVHSQTQSGSGKVGSEISISTNHLRNYSCSYWIDHARNCEPLLEDFDWGEFFGVRSRKWSQCLEIYQYDMRDKDWDEWYWIRNVDAMIVVASSQGSLSFIKWCLKRSNLGTDKNRLLGAALCNAARNRHEGVVKLLLGVEGVEPDSKDEGGRTPLSRAARNGHEAVVKLLQSRDSLSQ
jgi:ankyrin repeat protein